MVELDHLNIPLSGRNLIEASAGTGKTYAIACLYLRLLIEKRLSPEQILVVTYTEAATKELRGRIRSRIREAIGVLDGAGTTDTFLQGLCEKANRSDAGIAAASESLDGALKSFDTASIFTIHGFCLRALQDNAFESGSLYDTELVTDQAGLLQEIVDDFWRMRFFTEPAPLLSHALRNGHSPASYLKFLNGMLANPKVQVIPRFSADEIVALEERCRTAFACVQAAWATAQPEIVEILHSHKGLSRSADNYRADLLPCLLDGMVAFLEGDDVYALFDGYHKFCTRTLEKQQMKKHPRPSHPFFDLCEELHRSIDERFLALRGELVEFARQRLPIRKRERNIRFFDDLLTDLYEGLRGESGPAFAAVLREKYRAALIDEFQDTDPVQYDIFRKIYADPGCPLFLIGDPKQAIYSFRGADIFAYMEAAGDVGEDRRFTLTGNWRSTPRLLAAFNTVFTAGTRSFVYDEITYHPVMPGKTGGGAELILAAGDPAPLQVWHIPTGEDGATATVGRANAIAPAAVAAEIARLLREGAAGTALIDNRAVAPGDIAVIVRSHRQAGHIQSALSGLGIPSVMRSDMSIFATGEACEVCTLLRALADPGSEPKVRAALLTDILGRSLNDVASLIEDEEGWESCLERFRDYHHAWLDRGFMVMAQTLLAKEGVRGRLLRRPDGERRLTNLLHCLEVIHHKSHERGLGIEGLLTWFSERIAAGDTAEEYQIRLETDEKAVKIVTVHVSKGLEYPIVFCPFMWGGIRDNGEVATFHDRFAMVKDFGSPHFAQSRVLAQKECLAESLRLLYVALTRAQYRCYLLAGKITDNTRKNRPETSPLAYLFHAREDIRKGDDLVGLLAHDVSTLPAATMEEQLRTLQEKSGGAIAVTEVPGGDAAGAFVPPSDDGGPLAPRKFSRVVGSDWRVASFTSFAAHEVAAAELPDRDHAGPGDGLTGPGVIGAKNIFAFPKGAQAGIFIHEIFEGLDFAAISPGAIDAHVAKSLEKHGYDPDWLPHVSAMVHNVVTTPLKAPEGAFTLAGLGPGSWVPELEFFFPLQFITSELMSGLFRKWHEGYDAADLAQVCAALRFKPVRGMVRGFMDMVFEQAGRFYLVDWKSNHLGYRVEDYGPTALKAAMERNLYPLQYLLYTVALNRYLSLRVPGYDYATRFGGVVYVFLRGVSPAHGESFGFFRDLPPLELIDELTQGLIEAGG